MAAAWVKFIKDWQTVILGAGVILGALGTISGWGYEEIASDEVDKQIRKHHIVYVVPQLDTLTTAAATNSAAVIEIKWALLKQNRMLIALVGDSVAASVDDEIKKIREAIE